MTPPLSFAVGDSVGVPGRPVVRVTELDHEVALRLRTALIAVAMLRQVLTYEQAADAVDQRVVDQSVGRRLDVLTYDCEQRGEPPLSALVVSKQTRRASKGDLGDDEADRERCYQHWAS